MRKGECAVVLAPVPNGGLKVLAPASYLVAWKFWREAEARQWRSFCLEENRIPATQERVRELDEFRRELMEILELPPTQ